MAQPTKKQQAYYDAIIYLWPEHKNNLSPEKVTNLMMDACDKYFEAVIDCTKPVKGLLNSYASFYNGIRPTGWADIMIASSQMFYNWLRDTQNIKGFWNKAYEGCVKTQKGTYGRLILDYIYEDGNG